jgi:hypothetical protein
MAAPLILRNLSWALTTLLEVVLLWYLVRRKLYRSHPAFFVYILTAFAQSLLMAAVYRSLGSQSSTTFGIAWGTQAVVVCARWLAVVEIAQKALAAYSGIWALASRILIGIGVCVLGYAIVGSRLHWYLVILNADRAVELCTACFIVTMFLFIRYYGIAMPPFDRMLAIGFCLYSCFFVINDSVYEHWLRSGGPLWNYLDMLTFMASLFLWIKAARNYLEVRTTVTAPELTPELYAELSHRLNSRLHVLNNRLDRLFRSEDTRP